MAITIDVNKANQAAELIYRQFSDQGILGHSEMPEDLIPSGVVQGSLEHMMFITLTVSIDYQRDAITLWKNSRETFEDKETRYLFDPVRLHEKSFSNIASDMQKHGLSKKQTQDANTWRTIGITFYKKWQGNPINFLRYYDYDAPVILEALKVSTHTDNGREASDFPFLRGNKIGPLWIRMLKDNVGINELKNLDRVPIPVDIHVARASLALGLVKGKYEGKLEDLFEDIRLAWFEGVKGLKTKYRPMIALDLDEPLWHLSKYGCAERDKATGKCPVDCKCEVKDLCIPGKIKIENGKVEIDT